MCKVFQSHEKSIAQIRPRVDIAIQPKLSRQDLSL